MRGPPFDMRLNSRVETRRDTLEQTFNIGDSVSVLRPAALRDAFALPARDPGAPATG